MEQQNGQLIRYHIIVREFQLVYIRNQTIEVPADIRNITFDISESRVQLIENLHSNQTYTVRIAAATGAGIGPFSTAITVTTPEDGESSVYMCKSPVCIFTLLHKITMVLSLTGLC